MESRDDKKNIHFNPNFIARRTETQAKQKFHVNPVFFQKSGSQSAFLQSVQQTLSTSGGVFHPSTQFLQAVTPQKSVQNLSSSTQSSTHVQSQLYPTGSSSGILYNTGNQRSAFVNSQCLYSRSFSKQTQESCESPVNSSVYAWKTNPLSLQYTSIHSPAVSVASKNAGVLGTKDPLNPSRFKYHSQSQGKSSFSKYIGNVSESAKNKFKIDNRSGAHSVDKNHKRGFEKYCVIKDIEKRSANISQVTKSLRPVQTIDTTKNSFSNDRLRKGSESVPSAKSKNVHSLSSVRHRNIIDKSNSSSDESNLVLSNPTSSSQRLTLFKKEVPSPLSRNISSNFSTNLASSQIDGKQKSPVKSSNILINPNLLKSLSSNSKVDIVAIASQSSPKKLVPSFSSSDPKLERQIKKEAHNVAKSSPSMVSKYKVISRTKLVRRRSKSFSKAKITTPVRVRKDGSHITLCRPSPVFPTRPHIILAKNHPKRRYIVISRNKLVRRLSGSSSLIDDEKPKYSVKTKTKLVKRPATAVDKAVKVSSKGNNVTVGNEPKKNYMVLSKTKLIRNKAATGTMKAKVPRDGNKLNTRTIIRKHKLVRNVPIKFGKASVLKNLDPKVIRRINTKYKIENKGAGLSVKQKAAKGIVSKYRINRLKADSPSANINRRFIWVSSKGSQLQRTKKRDTSRFSDRFVNIGGILYKATKTSLHKQTVNKRLANDNRKGSKCILRLHGNQYSVSAGGRTLTRLESKRLSASKPVLSRVHIGGLTYSRTKTGHYELTKAHQARAVLSSAKHRSMITLTQKKRRGTLQKRNQDCIFFNRFGRCTKKDKGDCPYLHDVTKVAICTRFLRGRCPVSNCPFSHKIDPAKMPVCSHFVRSICTREGCPYRHVRVNPNAPLCLDFLHGHCPLGQECKKQHVLECEEFSSSGKCPRGEACPLSHRKGSRRKRKSITLEPVTTFSSRNRINVSHARRRKSNDSVDVLGVPSMKQKKRKILVANVEGMQKRYFHVGDAVGRKDTQSIEQKVSNMVSTVDGGIKGDLAMNYPHSEVQASGDRTKEELTGNIDGKEETQVDLDIGSKREKVLQKIERLKDLYEGQAGAPSGSKENNLAKNPVKRDTKRDMTKETEADVHDFKCDAFERRPLPKKMPSFISLSRDVGDVEDL